MITSPTSSPQEEDFVGLQNEVKIPLHADAGPELFEYAKSLRSDSTKAEQLLWEELRAKRFRTLKFRRQHPIHAFIADFYCHELRLVIEVDGGYHANAEQQKLDASRSKELERLDCRIIRFSNQEVENNMQKVLEKLTKVVNQLNGHKPPSSVVEKELNNSGINPLSSRRGLGRGEL